MRSLRAGSGRWSGSRAEKAGEERRVLTISAGAGGVVGGGVAGVVEGNGRAHALNPGKSRNRMPAFSLKKKKINL